MNKLILFTIILAILIVVGVLAYKSLERMNEGGSLEEPNEVALGLVIQESKID